MLVVLSEYLWNCSDRKASVQEDSEDDINH